jgi:hypothetical protein
MVVLREDGHQVLLRQRHLRHRRPGEYTGVRRYTWLYSEHTDTRYFSDVTFVTGDLHSTEGSESTHHHRRPGEYTGVRRYTWLYSEHKDTRYFSGNITFVTGDPESTQGLESTSGGTQSRRIPGTSQTASPSS